MVVRDPGDRVCDREAAGRADEGVVDEAGLVFAELSTDEYLARLDADIRKMLGHPAVDPVRPKPPPRTPRKAAKKSKSPVRVDQPKKKV